MADANTQTSGSAAQQNPLDVLEKLLEDTKKQSAGGQAGGDAPAAPAGPTEEEIAAAEKAKQIAEYEALKQAHALEDQKAIEEQKKVMEELQHTPQYQARVDQEADKADARQEVKDDQDGLEIRQLEKKKIVVNE